ncbi:hypothetical protein A6R68_21719, partial [Neotoma lepida]
TYQFAVDKPNTRLSELHAYHSSLTCFSEGTRICYLISTSENIWSISEQRCIEMGAHLVVINTEAE